MKHSVLILILVVTGAVASAQTEGARISGRVTDPEQRHHYRCRMQDHPTLSLTFPPVPPLLTKTEST